MINTFMLARDYDLVAPARRVARICRGKVLHHALHAHHVLQDYLTKKTRTVHRQEAWGASSLAAIVRSPPPWKRPFS